jgi:ferredoxin-NADP reductase
MPLAAKAGISSGVPVLVESSYGHQSAVSPHGGLPTPSVAYSNLVVIAGGVGITAALPILDNARSLYASQGTKKLFWGVHDGSEGLVNSVQGLVRASGSAVQEAFSPLPGLNATQWADIDVTIAVGERLDIRGLLEAELSSVTGTLVFVCGPAGLADDVRNTVTALGRHGALVQYVEEAFAW